MVFDYFISFERMAVPNGLEADRGESEKEPVQSQNRMRVIRVMSVTGLSFLKVPLSRKSG